MFTMWKINIIINFFLNISIIIIYTILYYWIIIEGSRCLYILNLEYSNSLKEGTELFAPTKTSINDLKGAKIFKLNIFYLYW